MPDTFCIDLGTPASASGAFQTSTGRSRIYTGFLTPPKDHWRTPKCAETSLSRLSIVFTKVLRESRLIRTRAEFQVQHRTRSAQDIGVE